MDRDRSVMTKKILDLTMEIIYLLTGEKYAAVKMTFIEGLLQGIYPPVLEGGGSSRSPILEHAPHSLEPERNNDEKIIEVAQKIIHLLTGEVPIRYQDVTVYFSMEEWEYLEGHKDLYKDVMMENQPPLTSPDESSNGNPPERCPRPLYSRDSTQEDQEIPHHHQDEDLNDGTVPCVKEETSSMADYRCLQEDIPPEISRDGHHTRRSSEERPTCSMIKDDVVEDSQGENLVTPNSHLGPHSADTSTDPSNSKNSCLKDLHTVMPSIHPGLQSVDGSLNPSNSEEPSPMELDTVSPNILLALSKSPDLSFPNEPPDKLHTAPNISPELRGSPHPTNPQESSLDVSHTLSPNIHLRLQNADDSLDLTNPEESTQDKSHTVTSNINLGLHNTDRPPESKELSPFKSAITSNIHLELNRSPDSSDPEESSSAPPQTDVNIYSGLHTSDRSVDASKPKESSSINAYTVTPKIHSAHECSLDGSPAFSLNIHPRVPSVDRSADPPNPRGCFPDKSHSVTLHTHPEPVPFNPEVCHPMQSQTAIANMHSERHRSLDLCCVGESSTTLHTIQNDNSGPHNTDRSLDPDESSATSHTISHVSPGPHSAERSPNPHYLEKSFATSHTSPNVNSVPHSEDRSQDLCYSHESSATLPTIPDVNSEPHSVERLPDPSYRGESLATSHSIPHVNSVPLIEDRSQDPSYSRESSSKSPTTTHVNSEHHSVERLPDSSYCDKSFAASPAISNVSSEPHSEDRSPDLCYPDESSSTSPTIPNVHSEVHSADNPTDPVNSWVSFLMKLHTGGSNMHSSLPTSPNPSDPDNCCDKQLSDPNMSPGFCSSSRSPYFTNHKESSTDQSNTVTSNLQPHHYSIDRIPYLYPGKPHTATLDVHQELPSMNRTPNSQESYLTKSHATIPSKLIKSREPSYSVESSASSQTPSNIHSGFDKADRSTDYLDLGVSSPVKSRTVSLNTQAIINGSLDPSFPGEPSEISHTTLNINAGLRSTSRSPHLLNPNECSLVISHTQNIHHYADRAMDLTNPEESSAEKPHTDTPDIHHSVSRAPDPEVSNPMKSHNILSNIYSELDSPDPSFSDKSSVGLHTAPNIHSGIQTEDRSEDPPIDYLLSNKLLITLNVNPELHLLDKSSNPSYPEEYSSMKSLIISPNIRSLRGRSPDPSPDESSDKLHTAPNTSLGLQSPDRSLHTSYPEEYTLDISNAVTPDIHSGLHSVVTTLDPEVSSHMTSQTITSNFHSLNRSPNSYYPDEFTAKSHLSPNNHAGHHIQNRSPEPSVAEHSPPNESLSVDLNLHPEHDSVNRLLEPAIAEQSPHNVSLSDDSTLHPEHDSVNRLPEPSIVEQSPPNVSLSVDSNLHPEHDSVNRLPEPSIAEQSPPNVSLSVDSNVLPEHQSVNRSPNHSHPKEYFPMNSCFVSPNICSSNRSPDSYYDESIAKSHSSPNIHAEQHGENTSPDPSIAQQSPPNVSLSVDSDVLPEHQSVNKSHNQSCPTEVFFMKSHSDSPNVCSLNRSPNSYYPDESSAKSHSSLNIHAEHHSENRSPDPSIAELSPPNVSLSVDSNVLPKPHSVDRSPNCSHLKELFSMESHTVIPNVGSAFESADRSPGPANLDEFSIDASQTLTPKCHSSYKSLDPIYNSEESPPIKAYTVCPISPLGLQSVDRSPDHEVSVHPMSQSVTQNADLQHHNVDSPPSPSNPKESRSTESPSVTTDILQELCNAHRCLDSSGLHESFQTLNLNIYYEPHSAHNLTDPCDPEELPPDGSLAITPTNHPEMCSLDRSPKSSEQSSLDKSYYVLPNIHLEPHKADRSTDTSSLQETSFEQTYNVTPNNDLALHQTLDASSSEKHSQNKSHAFNLNPSKPKRSLPKRSGCATGKADQNGLTEFSCKVCGRCFRRQSIYLKHWGMYCGKIFKEKSRLKQPRKKKSEKKSSPPAKRRELFKKKAVVLKEPNTQQSKGPYPCPECGKFYSQKSNLLQHRRIHTGVKPFSCLHCGKCFTKKISLVTHIRIHSGEKPFTCKQCGKCFGQQAHLDRHRKMHTGEKPYPCPECDKSFLQKCDLVKHRRIHTGLRPYLCSECGKSFTETSGLKRHRRLHR